MQAKWWSDQEDGVRDSLVEVMRMMHNFTVSSNTQMCVCLFKPIQTQKKREMSCRKKELEIGSSQFFAFSLSSLILFSTESFRNLFHSIHLFNHSFDLSLIRIPSSHHIIIFSPQNVAQMRNECLHLKQTWDGETEKRSGNLQHPLLLLEIDLLLLMPPTVTSTASGHAWQCWLLYS